MFERVKPCCMPRHLLIRFTPWGDTPAIMGEWSERTLMGNWCEERLNNSVPAQGAVVPPYGLALKLVRMVVTQLNSIVISC